MKTTNIKYDLAIIGGGFSGMNLAYRFSKDHNKRVVLLEKDNTLGGLASTFTYNGVEIEKFYHHWFTGDKAILGLISELGLDHLLISKPSNTGTYFANQLFRLSSPLDLLRYKPLSFFGRIRLGLGYILTNFIKDESSISQQSAKDWLVKIFGYEVFEKVWQPLLKGKFGKMYEDLSAIWIWKKLVLRGGSRAKDGREYLIYFEGSFHELTKKIEEQIVSNDGMVIKDFLASKLSLNNSKILNIETNKGQKIFADKVIFTTPPEITAKLCKSIVPSKELSALNRVKYLGNVCMVLFLTKSLSDFYWLNINDPEFPYVGIIEHTNFDEKFLQQDLNVVYLSRYCLIDDEYYLMKDDELLKHSLDALQTMFPDFKKEHLFDYTVWRSDYSQPFMEKNYADIIPPTTLLEDKIFQISMANIYPEDRGTNFAIEYTNNFLKNFDEKS
jgi:protoporphyrinogen oxidase